LQLMQRGAVRVSGKSMSLADVNPPGSMLWRFFFG